MNSHHSFRSLALSLTFLLLLVLSISSSEFLKPGYGIGALLLLALMWGGMVRLRGRFESAQPSALGQKGRVYTALPVYRHSR